MRSSFRQVARRQFSEEVQKTEYGEVVSHAHISERRSKIDYLLVCSGTEQASRTVPDQRADRDGVHALGSCGHRQEFNSYSKKNEKSLVS
jgi:hypothetical protein